MSKDSVATGNMRARKMLGMLVLQLQFADRTGIFWADATADLVDPETLTLHLPKIIAGEPLTAEERAAYEKTRLAARARNRVMERQAREFGTQQIIRALRKQLKDNAEKGERLWASVEPKGRLFNMDVIEAAFPGCSVYGNSNECSSDEFSIDVEVPEVR